MMKFFKVWFTINPWLVYFFMVLITTMIVYMQNTYILTDQVFYNSFSERFTIESIDQVISLGKSKEWVAYVVVPVYYLLQAFCISVCLNVGTLLYDWAITFKTLFRTVMNAMIIFTLGKVAYLISLSLSHVNRLEEIENADVFSLYSLLSSYIEEDWQKLILSQINVWVLLFIITLAIGIKLELGEKKRVTTFVLLTYGMGYILWMLLITFLIISNL